MFLLFGILKMLCATRQASLNETCTKQDVCRAALFSLFFFFASIWVDLPVWATLVAYCHDSMVRRHHQNIIFPFCRLLCQTGVTAIRMICCRCWRYRLYRVFLSIDHEFQFQLSASCDLLTSRRAAQALSIRAVHVESYQGLILYWPWKYRRAQDYITHKTFSFESPWTSLRDC